MNGKSLDITQEKLNKLKELIPEVFTEGDKLDIEKLRLTLGEEIELSNERYVLNWAGKSEAFKVLQTLTTATLAPYREESVNFDTTVNLFIEGENLEVLKVLQKSYFGKIKMIYIDPPYNTGNDSFIYPDRFSETKEEYLKRIGEKDEEGFMLKEGLFRKNSKENGQFHSNWLNMMYPRLFLARNLLREDGVIFVSIDDNEVHNLRLLMNEIFGEENFFAQIIIRANSRGQTYKQIAKTHEYIIIYTKADETDLFEIEKNELSFDLKLQDDISSFNLRELRNRNPKFGKHNRPNLFFPIYVNPGVTDKDGLFPISLKKTNNFNIEVLPLNSSGGESCWRWGITKVLENTNVNTLQSNLVAKKKNNNNYGIYEKYRKTTFKPKSIWEDNAFLTETGTVELKELGLEGYFDFPKPVNLVKQCLKLSTEDDDIILDFFAGSGTTAQAIYELNKEDGKVRNYILIQLPEIINKDTKAYKAGYKYISQICLERIKKAINKIKSNNQNIINDLGFKVFKLKYSNFKLWRGDVIENGDELTKQIEVFENPVKEGTEEENILYELILKSGYELTTKIEKKDELYIIADNALIIALTIIDESIIDRILKLEPKKCIALDKLFNGNDQLKTNTVLQMKDAGVEFKTV